MKRSEAGPGTAGFRRELGSSTPLGLWTAERPTALLSAGVAVSGALFLRFTTSDEITQQTEIQR